MPKHGQNKQGDVSKRANHRAARHALGHTREEGQTAKQNAEKARLKQHMKFSDTGCRLQKTLAIATLALLFAPVGLTKRETDSFEPKLGKGKAPSRKHTDLFSKEPSHDERGSKDEAPSFTSPDIKVAANILGSYGAVTPAKLENPASHMAVVGAPHKRGIPGGAAFYESGSGDDVCVGFVHARTAEGQNSLTIETLFTGNKEKDEATLRRCAEEVVANQDAYDTYEFKLFNKKGKVLAHCKGRAAELGESKDSTIELYHVTDPQGLGIKKMAELCIAEISKKHQEKLADLEPMLSYRQKLVDARMTELAKENAKS